MTLLIKVPPKQLGDVGQEDGSVHVGFVAIVILEPCIPSMWLMVETKTAHRACGAGPLGGEVTFKHWFAWRTNVRSSAHCM
jgi:hypothetical protein